MPKALQAKVAQKLEASGGDVYARAYVKCCWESNWRLCCDE